MTTRVLVLGGAGFIGRHAVAALLAQGCRVEIGSRHPHRIEQRLPVQARDCTRHQLRMEALQSAAQWTQAIAPFQVVVNCVGILRQRGAETYDRVHRQAPAALAAACAAQAVRLIHVSALGLRSEARSRFLSSKHAGEQAVFGSGADFAVVRPSLLDAPDDGYGARWLRRVARWPVQVLPADARGRIAALDVAELGLALARLSLLPALGASSTERIYELGGPEKFTLREYLAILGQRRQPALVLPVPSLLARVGSHLCDLLHLTPFSFGHWELLQRDNCPAPNRLAELLGRAPRHIGAAIKD